MCHQKDRYYVAPFPPPALPGFYGTMRLSDCLPPIRLSPSSSW